MFSLPTMDRNVGEAHLVAEIPISNMADTGQSWRPGLGIRIVSIVLTPCVRWREKYKQSHFVITCPRPARSA